MVYTYIATINLNIYYVILLLATFILAGEKPPVRSNQITFNWTKVFNLTSPNDTDDVTFNVTPTIMQISNNITYFTNTTTMTPKLDESRSKIEDNNFDLTTEIFQGNIQSFLVAQKFT